KTFLSTALMRVSSARATPMPLPISELFHGTMTSDFGASWLPRIDMPDMALTSGSSFCACAALMAQASNVVESRIRLSICRPLQIRAQAQVFDPDRDRLVRRHELGVALIVEERAARVLQVQIAEHADVLARDVQVRIRREGLLVARARLGEAPLLAVDETQRGQRHGVAGRERSGLLERRGGVREIVALRVGQTQIAVRVHELGMVGRD